uniref:Transposase-associated domain-containing protein n=1 Tax=Ditylenchus dipsaci TaxID=166011 RepID=A0A915EA21_9BILA
MTSNFTFIFFALVAVRFPLASAASIANRGLEGEKMLYLWIMSVSDDMNGLADLETGQADKNTIFRPVATALGEGDNWVYFPKTVKFFWHMWSFYDWMEEIKQKNYSTAFHYQKDVFGGILCPCKMCLTLDASTCIDVSKDRVERISQSG